MLGLLDFVKAVRGSVTVALRRVHPLTGPALLVALWVVALGSFFWMSGKDDGPTEQASRGVAQTEESPDASSRPTGADTDAEDSDEAPAAGESTTTTVPGELSDVLDTAQARADEGADSPTAPVAADNRPSFTTSSSTPASSTTTSPRPPAPTTTTTTTTPPNNGGLLGGLLDALGLG